MSLSRRKSNTTIVAFANDDCVIVGADSRVTCPSYGRVLDDTCVKFFTVCDDKVYVVCSGDGGVHDELVKIIPFDFDDQRKQPKNIAEVAEVILDWVNYFTESFQVNVKLIVVGAVGKEKYKIFSIIPDAKKVNTPEFWKHVMVLVDSKIIAVGSGSIYALQVLDKNKSLIDAPTMNEEEGIELVSNALKASVRKDAGTGGTLRIEYMTKEKVRHRFWVPELTEYCESHYAPPDDWFD